MKNDNPELITIVKEIVRIADSKKAENIVALDVDKVSDIASYLVILNGSNPIQNKAIAGDIYDNLAVIKVKPLHIEGSTDRTWILMDYGEIIVHIFMPETRGFYDLEGLWADAPKLDVSSLLTK